jgi:hypothetical protein
MARISYDEVTAAAFKAVREVPRDGLSEWREAVRRHLDGRCPRDLIPTSRARRSRSRRGGVVVLSQTFTL